MSRCPFCAVRLIQRNQPARLSGAEPWMSYPLAGFSDQPQYTALGKPVPSTEFCRGKPRHMLRYQALDRLSLRPSSDVSSTLCGYGALRCRGLIPTLTLGDLCAKTCEVPPQ